MTAPRASAGATILAILGYIVLVAVVGCVAVMSWSGLVGFARDELQITSGLRFVVPLSLDAAAMTCAFLALRAVVLGDSAAGARLLVLAFVAGSAAANITHADRHGGLTAAWYFGGMSLAAWALFELVLRHVRRDVLRTAGALEPPLVRFRGIRWARFPLATFRAWSLAVEHGITRADAALTMARSGQRPGRHDGGISAAAPAPTPEAPRASDPAATPESGPAPRARAAAERRSPVPRHEGPPRPASTTSKFDQRAAMELFIVTRRDAGHKVSGDLIDREFHVRKGTGAALIRELATASNGHTP